MPSLKTILTWLAVGPVLGCIASSSAAQNTTDAVTGRSKPTARALLIGIGEYRSDEIKDLGGPVNDLSLMKHLLISRFGFKPANIQTLQDAEATRKRILQALRKIVKETRPKDLLYIHYSGHGSQVKDLNGDEKRGEADELDETLIPHDGRTDGVPDIVDDELDKIFSKLETDRAVIVLDSCHSGTGTRRAEGIALQERKIPLEDRSRLHLYRHLAVVERDVVKTGERHLLMTGAASFQTALDGPVGGKTYGFFTHSLAYALGRAKAGASVKDVFAQAQKEHQRIQEKYNLTDLRVPQLEARDARRLRQPIFRGMKTRARLPWVRVKASGNPREVILTGATRAGAVVGSHWAIYKKNSTSFPRGKALAWGFVHQVTGSNAWLKLRWARKNRGSLDGCRAVVMGRQTNRRVPVRIAGGDRAQQRRVEKQLSSLVGGVRFVDKDSFAKFTVKLEPVAHRVIGADGSQTVAVLPASHDARKIAQVITRSAMSSDLLSLDNPSSAMRLDVRIGSQTQAFTRTTRKRMRGIKLVANTAGRRYRIRKENEPRSHKNSLLLHIRAPQDCFITIVSVDSKGKVNLLFPNPASEEAGFLPRGELRAGQNVTIPDSLDDENRATFHFDYTEPPGLDTVRVFAAETLETAELIRRSMRNIADAPRFVGDAETEVEDPRQELIDQLRSQLNTVVARGIKIVRGVKVVKNRPKKPKQNKDQTAEEEASDDEEFEEEDVTEEEVRVSDWTAVSVTIRVSRSR